MSNFEPLAAAQRAVHLSRTGQPLSFDDGPIGDLERDALAEGFPLWLQAKAGNIYLAANASWPGLFKVGCTRRSVEQRMRQLGGAGMVTPWVAVRSWRVHDAHGLEAQAHRACAGWLVKGELFRAEVDQLARVVAEVVCADRRRLEKTLQFCLSGQTLDLLAGKVSTQSPYDGSPLKSDLTA